MIHDSFLIIELIQFASPEDLPSMAMVFPDVFRNYRSQIEAFYHQIVTQQTTDCKTITNYRSGTIRMVEFYIDGNLWKISHYRDGMKHGEFKRYTRSGVVIEEGQFQYDQPVGLFIYRYTSGIKMREINFETCSKRSYYYDGSLMSFSSLLTQ